MSEENTTQGNTPGNGSPSERVLIPELEEFIFKPDEYTDFVVPRRLSPPKVAQFLIQKIEKDTKLEAFVQVERVAKFYDSNEVTEKYKSFLDKTESNSDEIMRSIIIARIIAVLGDRKDQQFAKNYYQYLVGKVETKEEFEELIVLHENLGLGKDSGALRRRIDSELKELEERKETDSKARIRYSQLKQGIDLKLRQAEEIQSVKDKILATNDRKERLVEEIKLYLFPIYGVPEITQPWVARRIRQETWGKQPPEQTERNDKQPFKRDVTIALRDFLTDLDKHKKLENEERNAAKLRLLRAIKFFDGKITEEEEVFLKSFEGKQIDILANSGYLLPGA